MGCKLCAKARHNPEISQQLPPSKQLFGGYRVVDSGALRESRFQKHEQCALHQAAVAYHNSKLPDSAAPPHEHWLKARRAMGDL